MFRKSGLLAAAVTLIFAGGAHAESLAPVQGRAVALGQVSGVVYYTVEPDGYRVVATLQAGETHSVVRLMATLTPGQSVVLSTPGAAGEPAIEVRFARHGDELSVERGVIVDVKSVARAIPTQ